MVFWGLVGPGAVWLFLLFAPCGQDLNLLGGASNGLKRSETQHVLRGLDI